MKYSFERIGGIAAPTCKITIGNTAASLVDLIDAAASVTINWDLVRTVELHIEDNDCRIAFGVDAANGAAPVGGLRYVGQRERIPNLERIRDASVINAVNASVCVIMVDVEEQADF